jgi:hypothetical protein
MIITTLLLSLGHIPFTNRRRSAKVERRLLNLTLPTRSAAATVPLGLFPATPPAAAGGWDLRGERPEMADGGAPVRLHGDGVGMILLLVRLKIWTLVPCLGTELLDIREGRDTTT